MISSDFPYEIHLEDGMNACFAAFDKNGDGFLCRNEFERICHALFRNDEGIVYKLSEQQFEDIFKTFDADGNNFIDLNEFDFCWNKWIKTIIRPVCALLIVDVQNDFISGSLSISQCSAKHDGQEVIKPINNLLDTTRFQAVFYSMDCHPPDHVSFIENLHLRKLHPSSTVTAENAKVYDTVTFAGPPVMQQRLWPRHCVQDTWGVELHADLKVVPDAVKIYKGTHSEVDSYSVFWDNMKLMQTDLSTQLNRRNVTDIFVCGIAYDVCVGSTIVDALGAGYRTILLEDCCRGLDIEEIERTKTNFIKNYGVVVDSTKAKCMVEGRDRRPELGYKLAKELKKERANDAATKGSE